MQVRLVLNSTAIFRKINIKINAHTLLWIRKSPSLTCLSFMGREKLTPEIALKK